MSKQGTPTYKRVISRRVLLAAGGLVVVGEYLAGQGNAARHLTGSATSSASGPRPQTPNATPGPGAPAAANASGAPSASATTRAPGAADNTRSAGDPSAAEAPGTTKALGTTEAPENSPATEAPYTAASTPGAKGTHAPGATHEAAHPAGADPAQPMFYLDDGPKIIALTIDDGPDPVYTPQVLSLLARYRITATFSMIGISVAADRGLAREVSAAGHEIVNHTWTHADLTRLAPGAVSSQLTRTNDLIAATIGRSPTMFRAPYGAWSPAVLDRCQQLKLAPLDWSVDPRDWARPGVSSIVDTILRTTRSGSIILEHDGGGNRSQTVAALTIVLPELLAAGYRFRTPLPQPH